MLVTKMVLIGMAKPGDVLLITHKTKLHIIVYLHTECYFFF